MIQKSLNIATAFGVVLLWTLFISFVFYFVNTGSVMPPEFKPMLDKVPDQYKAWVIFKSCLVAPIVEEVIFRMGPLMIVRNMPKNIITGTIILSSFVFGLMHGSFYNVLIQGVMGLILCKLYLADGYWSCVILHFIWNFLIVFGFFAFMG